MHNRVIGIGVSVVLVAALFGAAGSSGAAPAGPVVKTAIVGPQSGGGEPSLAIALDGSEYATWPAGTGTPLYRSTDNGKTWTAAAFADTQSGDDSVNVDQSGAVYLGNLNGAETNPNALQASVYKSTDGGKTWPQHGTSLGGDNASSMPFLVDRPWTDAWIPAQKTTKDALVYVQYHDFGPGVVWVNSSTDGGKTFGNPVNVINSPTAIADSACNAMPGGVKVVQSGPHAGRVYVSWLAADDAQNGATGCNETQLAGFHTMWVAWSDDGGQTWTDQLVYDGGIGRDGSEFWPDITLDNKGNPYVAFAMNIGSEFDIWISASFDGGKTWNGKSDGTGAPFKANLDAGTHYFPAIAAGAPGKVAVAFLGTTTTVAVRPNGKPDATTDQSAKWNAYLSESYNIRSAKPTFHEVKVSHTPMHDGDVCTLGLFCAAVPGTDRNLLDFIDVQVDPRGFAHVLYTDDRNYKGGAIVAGNQVGGPRLGRGGH
ncbi:MAG: hypothetical protein QOC87_2025 [Actinomycetota bacterium]|nr:hypothetical protein [Actinomycetota bacterium]